MIKTTCFVVFFFFPVYPPVLKQTKKQAECEQLDLSAIICTMLSYLD